jgi:hypothetical protein
MKPNMRGTKAENILGSMTGSQDLLQELSFTEEDPSQNRVHFETSHRVDTGEEKIINR